jgi:hypothetical protein
MPFLATLGDVRDVFIIIYGAAGIIFFFVGIVILIALYFTLKGLLKSVSGLMDESVKPTLASVKDVADTVRGTADVVGRNAVAPIAKTYGTVAGLRRGLGVLSGLGGRKGKYPAMKIAIFFGLIIGAVAAVLSASKSEPDPDDHSPLAEFKRHAKSAVDAGKQEAAATEADIYKQYEDAKSGKG